jgi:glycosyltransferase involved in cell wall biosynthesis
MMKKLLFISPSFPKDATESYIIPFLQHVLLAFKNQYPNIEITIITIHKPVFKGIYYWNGIKIISLGGNNIKFPLKFIFLKKSFFKIYKLNRLNQYDGVLNFWYNEFSVFSNFLEIKNYSWMLGQDVKKENKILRLFKPNPKKIVALSQFNNEFLFQTSKIYSHKIIPMAINDTLFPNLNLENRPIDVFGAGWLSELKNYSFFLEIIKNLKETKPYIKVEIAGEGEEKRKLIDFVNSNNLEENITFLGLLSHQETLEKMNNSKVFLHTSTFEGGSTVYFEALFSGCQLVGTLPMMDREIENFHYHTSKQEIVTKINYLLENHKAPKRIIYYTMNHVCKEIYNLFYC